ncbi:DUF5004 domain-containing protein [Fulvivirga lutea]|uniref:DUF5004 domain-containing protein n=1 Tax=Fulvivirga lutea TaxID=2810512 RepID=A0A974WDP6_9BACT|nr:DUF5004 domain-containing protein [Fulvivirga lutea]QSE96239.1 DUF5004 domain-containing protein [Fulvivirga lutea]
MKNIIKNKWTYMLAITLLVVTACSDDIEDLKLEPAESKTALLSGTWALTSVIQTDEDAVRKGFPEFVLREDITSLFDFTDLVLTLNADGTYSVTAGNSPNIVGSTSGTYSLDNQEFPSQILFEGGRTIDIGTYEGLSEGVLTLKFVRYQRNSEGEITNAFLSYEYKFERQ